MFVHFEVRIDNGYKPIIKYFDDLEEAFKWLEEKRYLPNDGYTDVRICKVDQIFWSKL